MWLQLAMRHAPRGSVARRACLSDHVARGLQLHVAPGVAAALNAAGPVVALESTIISHGMVRTVHVSRKHAFASSCPPVFAPSAGLH